MVKLLTLLPLPIAAWVGEQLGRCAYYFAGYRRHIVMTNFRLCYPGITDKELRSKAKESFRYLGRGYIESAIAWFAPNRKFAKCYSIAGLEHLENALADGHGVILISPHFTTLDLLGRFVALNANLSVMYRPHDNELFNTLMCRSRQKSYEHVIEKNNAKLMLTVLKKGGIVGYMPDQDYGERGSIFMPFMGREAACITATSKFAQITGAKVIPVTCYLKDKRGQYHIELQDALTDFPTHDLKTDTRRVMDIMEEMIKRQPMTYLWHHRRYKTQPANRPHPYENKPLQIKKIKPARLAKMLKNARPVTTLPQTGELYLRDKDQYLLFFTNKRYWHIPWLYRTKLLKVVHKHLQNFGFSESKISIRRLYKVEDNRYLVVCCAS